MEMYFSLASSSSSLSLHALKMEDKLGREAVSLWSYQSSDHQTFHGLGLWEG